MMDDQFDRLRHSRDCVRSHLPAGYDRGGEVLTLGACTCERDEIVRRAIKRERDLRAARDHAARTVERLRAAIEDAIEDIRRGTLGMTVDDLRSALAASTGASDGARESAP